VGKRAAVKKRLTLLSPAYGPDQEAPSFKEGNTTMNSCPPDWSALGSILLGLAALLVALPLGFILWFVFARTVAFNPPPEKQNVEF
jgi:hypothetical protein